MHNLKKRKQPYSTHFSLHASIKNPKETNSAIQPDKSQVTHTELTQHIQNHMRTTHKQLNDRGHPHITHIGKDTQPHIQTHTHIKSVPCRKYNTHTQHTQIFWSQFTQGAKQISHTT